MDNDRRPRLTYRQAFNFLADLVALIDHVPRESITPQSKLSRDALRQFNILIRTKLKPEPRVGSGLVWGPDTTLDQLVRQIDLEPERSDL